MRRSPFLPLLLTSLLSGVPLLLSPPQLRAEEPSAASPPPTVPATPTAAEAEADTRNAAPQPPKGYPSRAAVMAAVATGLLPLIKQEQQPPEDVREIKDIEYGRVGDRALTLDIDLPKHPRGPVPGLIFIHGGAWKGGERTIYHYYTRRFAQRGYAAATVSYRLSGEATYPAAIHDVKCAVRWMRAHAAEYGIDPERLAAIGGSAGGHLAMMIGYCDAPHLEGDAGHAGVSSEVAAVVNFYGPVDLTTEMGQKASVVKQFLATSYDQNPKRYEEASPLTHLDAHDPPTLIVHGTLDDVVPVDQADLLAKRLGELGIAHEYARLEGWPHTLDAARPANDYCQELMLRFFDEHLADEPNPQDSSAKQTSESQPATAVK